MIFRCLLIFLFGITIGLVNSYDERYLQDKVAVVTGAAQGIGYAIADNFLNAGVKTLIILDYQFKKGSEAVASLNDIYGETRAVFMYCDVTKDLERIFFRILEEYGHIDVFVNDAGVLDDDSPDSTIKTNTLALIEWSLKVWQHMRKDRGGNCGTIINLASVLGYTVQPFIPVYAASKFAVIGFTKSLGHNYTYRNTCVRVVALCPGLTYTAMTRQRMVTPEQLKDFNKFKNASEWQTADDVGRAAVKVFETADSGTAWKIDGGIPPVEAPVTEMLTVAYIDKLL